jgi:hypothetical protein
MSRPDVISSPPEVLAALNGKLQLYGKKVLVLRNGKTTAELAAEIFGAISKLPGYYMSKRCRGLSKPGHFGPQLAKVTAAEFQDLLNQLFIPAEKHNFGVLLLDHWPPFLASTLCQPRWVTDEIWNLFEADPTEVAKPKGKKL